MFVMELLTLALLLALLVRSSKIAGEVAALDSRFAQFETLFRSSLGTPGPATAASDHALSGQAAPSDVGANDSVEQPDAPSSVPRSLVATDERSEEFGRLDVPGDPSPEAPVVALAAGDGGSDQASEPVAGQSPAQEGMAEVDIQNDGPGQPLGSLPPSWPARPRPDFELNFGRRWAVLIGGSAVVLGSILLVRHSIVEGYFPPSWRLIAAAVFSLVLIGAAEFLRRNGTFAAITSLPRGVPDIPATLFGAGAAGLFATIFAAHAVYDLVGPGLAFTLMGAVALSGVLASLQYGPQLAAFGYLAAESVPLLVGGHAGMTTACYVGGVGLATYAVTWRRGWSWLEVVVAAVLSGWVLLLGESSHVDAAVVAAAAALGVILVAVLRRNTDRARASRQPGDAPLTLSLALVVLSGAAVAMPVPIVYQALPTIVGLTVVVAALAASILIPSAHRAGPIAALGIVIVLAKLFGSVPNTDGYARLRPVIGLTAQHGVHLFMWISAVALCLALAAVRRMSRMAPSAAMFGIGSVVGLMIGGDLVLKNIGHVDRNLLAGLCFAQGAVLLAIAWPSRGRIPQHREFASVLAATGGLGLLGLVPVVLFTGPTLVLALSLLTLAAATLAVHWRAAALIPVAAAICAAMLVYSGVDGTRTFLRFRQAAGADLWPLLVNTALPGLLVMAAILLLRQRMPREDFERGEALWRSWLGLGQRGAHLPLSGVVMTASAGALLLSALVITIRWLVFGNAYATLEAPSDFGVFAALALSGALTVLRLYRATGTAVLLRAVEALAVIGAALLGVALVFNPFTATHDVGRVPVLNLLALSYLVPAAVAVGLGVSWRRAALTELKTIGLMAGFVAVAGSFAFVTFSVTQAFQGRTVFLAGVRESELWAYTLVWLLYAIGLLLIGLRADVRWLRVTAFAVMIAVILKAFLVDLSHLTGVARAMSFIALGLVLLGVGMFYQRIMGRQQTEAA